MNPTTHVFIIAEAGVNHNGSVEMAIRLIDAAAEAGADAVKFQTFKAAKLASRLANKAAYQVRNTGEDDSQLAMLRKLELDEAAHGVLMSHSASRGIGFLSTPFDTESLDLLVRLDLPCIKISSGDITNAPFLLDIARTGKPIILSTGMSTLAEIEGALSALAFGYLTPEEAMPSVDAFVAAYNSSAGQAALEKHVTLLHCTTEYPAPFEDVNLDAMNSMACAFGLPVGYSDHTTGISVPIAAAALGAKVIEKHFTLDRNLPGPDHKASLEPDELKMMVAGIREVEAALGSPLKKIAPSEIENRPAGRKSLVASRDIHKGELFTAENLALKRPGDGISPMRYWEWLGKTADRDFLQDEQIQ
ncbi:MAG: N-acetylneuraminate synthase [Betaproteobacteria bacterium]|nr:N-acetylneuraminate synthase [Betaproteobacteria bacterium]